MQVDGRKGFAGLPLACALCSKSNRFKSSYVLWRVVHRFFHNQPWKFLEAFARSNRQNRELWRPGRAEVIRGSECVQFVELIKSTLSLLLPVPMPVVANHLRQLSIELFFLATFIPLRNHLVSASQDRSGPRAISLAD